MDNNMHVNIRATKTGDINSSFVKERIWRRLVSFNSWILNGVAMPSYTGEGLGLTLILNTAVIIESVVGE